MRIIKTYAKGRFYDTGDKQYISKDQLTDWIDKNETFKIIMHHTGKDVTRSVLKKMGVVAKPPKESVLNIDNLKKWLSDQIDRRIEKAIKLINLPTKGQINRLTADIETLAEQVDELQNRLVLAAPAAASSPTDTAETIGGQA